MGKSFAEFFEEARPFYNYPVLFQVSDRNGNIVELWVDHRCPSPIYLDTELVGSKDLFMPVGGSITISYGDDV